MITCVIFDMDGVLIDSEHAITLAAEEALNAFGIPARYEDFKPFTGMGEDRFVGGVAEQHGFAFTPAMKDKAYEIYTRTAAERVTVYPLSRQVLIALGERNIPFALASAADAVKVECNLACIGVDPSLFSAIVTGSDVKNKKPHPEIFLTAAQKTGFSPATALVVEDALSGVKAAKAAGMTCLALTTSFGAQELRAAGADYTGSDLNALWDIIEGTAST